MKKLFLIASIVVIVTGALMTFVGGAIFETEMYLIMGPIVLIFGIIFLISGMFSKGVAETNQAKILAAIMIFGSLLGIIGLPLDGDGQIISIAGSVFLILIFLVWPCLCCQGQKDTSSQVIGVASAHDSISIGEISGITGCDEKMVREAIYDAIGKGRLRGKMQGDTFIRAAATTTTYSAPTTTTREREIVTVLVICPFCGAKTEQGIGKCQNCQAAL
ncbi:MAG: hypothetical protein E4H14_07785 [Candidatus Thorarchaeota archaeon]|nr:MAG: hypothetical protein E4H14_07785 [Candidatus Thorarchaeota archaeon]